MAGDALTFAGPIASAQSSAAGDLEVAEGTVTYVPAAISAMEVVDEVIAFTMEDGAVYNVHTIPEAFPALSVTGSGVAEENAGVYSFALDKFMTRVATNGEILYYRNLNCTGELMAENFAAQPFGDTQYYTLFVELNPGFRNANGGFSSGFYLVMDENYTDIEEVTLAANEE